MVGYHFDEKNGLRYHVKGLIDKAEELDEKVRSLSGNWSEVNFDIRAQPLEFGTVGLTLRRANLIFMLQADADVPW